MIKLIRKCVNLCILIPAIIVGSIFKVIGICIEFLNGKFTMRGY